jgi:uncharacterized LabA/DUF88 family protein
LSTAPNDLIQNAIFPGETLALFVDGAHLSQIARQLEFEIDFEAFRAQFAGASDLHSAYYYMAVKPPGQDDPAIRLLDWMQLHGWRPRTKSLRMMDDDVGRARFDVEMSVDMVRMSEFADHLIVISGNGDFTYLLANLQDNGKRITLVSSKKTPKAMLSNDLLRQADNFIDLADLKPLVSRRR